MKLKNCNERVKPVKIKLLGVHDKWEFDPVSDNDFPIDTITCQMINGIGDATECVKFTGKIYHINWFKHEKL